MKVANRLEYFVYLTKSTEMQPYNLNDKSQQRRQYEKHFVTIMNKLLRVALIGDARGIIQCNAQ